MMKERSNLVNTFFRFFIFVSITVRTRVRPAVPEILVLIKNAKFVDSPKRMSG